MSTPPASTSLRFGRFELQLQERRLLADGLPSHIGARAFDLLTALTERPLQLVRKHELLELVWPGQVVEESNIAVHVNALRKLLGNHAIANVPGRGYRLTLPVERAVTQPAPKPAAEAVAVAVAVAVAPEASTPRLPTHLPASLSALLGREDELAALEQLVIGHRLVSLVGAGGIGKTLLAQHLLDRRRAAYAHGVCWIELAQVSEPNVLPSVLAAALGVTIEGACPSAGLAAAASRLQVLLTLDNAEHLAPAVARLASVLMAAAPGLCMLVTSQVPLNVASERVYRLGALSLPAGPLAAAEALRYGAVKLFVDRAHSADASFALNDQNAAAVIEVCCALDGVPLAIELAAARAPLLGLRQLSGLMRDRLHLLTSHPNREAPARMQTLRSALEWSHGLLHEREQRVFRRLAVIHSSASLDLLQLLLVDTTPGQEMDKWEALDALGLLVDRSLVAVIPSEDDALPRYRLLESPRAYALERLEAAGEVEAMRRCHAQALAAIFDAAWDERYSGRVGVLAWGDSLAPDCDNAREAMAWAISAAEDRIALQIGATLLPVMARSMHAERLALADTCERLAKPEMPTALQWRTWVELADFQTGRVSRSRTAAAKALALAHLLERENADPWYRYLALSKQTDDPQHLFATREAVEQMRALEPSGWPAHRLMLRADMETRVAHFSGAPEEAVAQARRLCALTAQAGNIQSKATNILIDVELAAGDAASAARRGQALVAQLERGRDEFGLAYSRLNLVAALVTLGDPGAARAVASAAWPLTLRFELNPYLADHLALLAALESRPSVAAQVIGYAEVHYERRREVKQPNEAASVARATDIAQAALGADEFERLRALGAALRDDQIGPLMFDQPA